MMKVLISEKNCDIRNLYKMILRPFDADIKFVETAAEIEKVTRWINFDLVIIEIGIPFSEGITVGKHLRKKCPNLPVIMISSVNVEGHELNPLLACPLTMYLMKPFDISYLRISIQKLIEKRSGPEVKPLTSMNSNMLLPAAV